MIVSQNENYEHGDRISELKSSEILELNSFQFKILNTLQPDKDTWDSFLHPEKSENFTSPFYLPDLLEAVLLIREFSFQKKHILLFGDRDTDGVSSASILGRYFQKTHEKKGGKITVKTSSQNDDYGLCESVMSEIEKINPDLLITLDLGTSNFSEINTLADQGIRVVVIDHHEIPKEIPNCFLINPKRTDSPYPEKKICTATLSLKMILALIFAESEIFQKIVSSEIPRIEKIQQLSVAFSDFFIKEKKISSAFNHYVGLSAIGTITDMMPLVGENRSIVKRGCISLRKNGFPEIKKNPGVVSLIQNLSLNEEKITSKEIGWAIGPVLNAAGRMGKTEVAVDLLLSDDEYNIQTLSRELIQINQERKERTMRNFEKVKIHFMKNPEKKNKQIIFCYDPELESGVSGIVATKLVEEFRRPVIFITPENVNARGSVRSFGKENVIDLLEGLKNILLHFGGHPEAGGFSVRIEDLGKLEEEVERVASSWLNGGNSAVIESKRSVVSFHAHELKESHFKEIEVFEPFGQGNENPTLSIVNAKVINFTSIGDGSHGRFGLLGCDPKIKFIIWRKAKEFLSLTSKKDSIEIWGNLEENYFNKKSTVQFVVQHFQ